jgi:CHAT domain-containing protein
VEVKVTNEFNKKFYEVLATKKVTKAKALQEAQKEILKDKKNTPRSWAPYILVGNWL